MVNTARKGRKLTPEEGKAIGLAHRDRYRAKRARAKERAAARKWPLESDEQEALCRILDARGIDYHASVNGVRLAGSRKLGARYWEKLAARGAKAGVPDLEIISHPRGGRGPVYVEMKRAKAAKPRVTGVQTEYHELLRSLGYVVVVGYGAKDAWEKLQEVGYGGE